MRHVRMLGTSLAAAMATGAVAMLLVAPASAATSPHGPFYRNYLKFYNCPANDPELNGCIHGEATPESFFQAGKVTVHFVKPVDLNGGFVETESGEFIWIGARNGNSIVNVKEPTVSLTEGLDTEALTPLEKERYEKYLAKGGSTKVTETIEQANPSIFLSEGALIEEKGQGFGFNVMIHIENPFLGKDCYDGSTDFPINVPFTTGETHPEPPNTTIHGFKGNFTSEAEGEILDIKGQRLVNNEYAAPGVEGCGVDGEADAAVDAGLGLPSPAGSNTTVLVGNLWQTSVRAAREELKF